MIEPSLPAVPLLALFFVLTVLAVAGSLLIPRWLRPEGRGGTVSDADQLAWLAGGLRQYADVQITRLYARGAVSIASRRGLVMRQPPSAGRSAAEIAVLNLTSPASQPAVYGQLRGQGGKVRERLVETGLLIDPATAIQMRCWQTLPLAALIVVGMATLPGGTLWAFLFVLAAAAILCFAVLDLRSHAGLAVLAEARSRHERLRLAAPRDEAAMAVALFGTAALVGSALSDIHRLSSGPGAVSGCGGGGGCASDGSSDGGGGGGCGGGCGS